MSTSKEKAVKFSQRFTDDATAMMLGPLCWFGIQLKLFECLASNEEGMTYKEFAEASKCNERYMKEWLHAMTCAEYLDYNSETKKFILPPEHQPFLIPSENNENYGGGVFNAFRIFNESAPKYLHCIQNGGGLCLDEIHPEIGDAVEGFTGPTQKFRVVPIITEALPEVHDRLKTGITVVDVGCGVGHAIIALAKEYPNSKFIGFEPHEASFYRAKANILDKFGDGACNVEILNSTSAELETGKYDFITTWDVVHDLIDPVSFLKDIHRGLKDSDSVYLMNEVPASGTLEDNLNRHYALAYALSMMYCTTVSLAGGGPAYGACMGEKIAEDLCKEANFSSFEIIRNAPRLYKVKK